MLSRRTFIKLAIYTVVAIPSYHFFGKQAFGRISAWAGRHRPMEALLKQGFGPFRDISVLSPFISFVAKEHPHLLSDDYESDVLQARNVTALFMVNSNLPDNGFESESYEFAIRGPYCNPFANTEV